MGFFDSMKGFLSGVGDLVGGIVQSPVGAIFAQAGAQKLFGLPQTFPGGFQMPPQFPAQQFPQFQRQLPSAPPPFLPQTRDARPFQPFDFSQAPQPEPFGGPMSAFPTDRFQGGGVMPAAFDIPGFDLRSPFVGQGAGANTCAPMFVPTQARIRPASLVMVPNPMTGAPTFFKHAGKPLLFSGDLRAAKMVHKLARRARRASPRR